MSIETISYNIRKGLSIYWFNKSKELGESADVLWTNKDGHYSVYMMLYGMSLELIYKAIAVANNNEPDTKSHNLKELAERAGLNVKEQHNLLEKLTEYIYWNGRYPVPKKLKLSEEKKLSREEFIHSLNVMPANHHELERESIIKLWNDAFDVYWPLHKNEIEDNNKYSMYFKNQ